MTECERQAQFRFCAGAGIPHPISILSARREGLTEIESLIVRKIDDVHARINDMHIRMEELAKSAAALEVQVTELVGNGQPGKIRRMEEEIAAHSKFMWILLGLLGASSLSELATHGGELFKMLF
jgi:hypothetical protein